MIQFEVNVITFSVSFKSIFSCILRMTMLISGSSNLPLDFVFESARFVIYIHLILLVTVSSQCLFSNLDRFSLTLSWVLMSPLRLLFSFLRFVISSSSDCILVCRETISFERLVTNSELGVIVLIMPFI